MEFKFNVNEVLPEEITKIGPSMLPPGFTGDRRKLWDAQSKLSDIVNIVGEKSAHAQGLTKPITTADKMKSSEHTLYLLTDRNGSVGNGAVMGMLKMGRKGLYIFDRQGQHHQLKPLCVLDFYVHESYQRMGLGKKIFEHMLKEENIEPVCLAIDRPSPKFLGFLKKHYSLSGPVPQMNNFVVFDGFFNKETQQQIANSPNHQHPYHSPDNNNSHASNGTPTKSQNGFHVSPYGRYGAPRPICSMGQIIHNHTPAVQPTEPSSDPHIQPPVHQSPKLERPRSLSLHTDEPEPEPEQQQRQQSIAKHDETIEEIIDDQLDSIEHNLHLDIEQLEIAKKMVANAASHAPKVKISERENNIIPDEKPAEYTPRTPSNLTEQGFLDLKFYHSRLW